MERIVFRVLSGCLPLLVAAGGAERAPEPAGQTSTVGVVTAQVGDVPLVQNLAGRLPAFRSAGVNARVAGVVVKRAYVEGSEVRKGQLLFLIGPAPLKAALASATAQLARDKAIFAQARSDLARYEELHREKSIAEQRYIDQKFLVQQQEATVRLDAAGVETVRINLNYAYVTSPIARGDVELAASVASRSR